ncbi:MAG: endonuclease, partial [Candidatus Yanofskybacteria bacterium CG10_big_fil_rev_8_21_14_0_10_37_15]
MTYLYILRNIKNKHYTGITAIDPRKRLLRHNKGDVFSTKMDRPWTLIHVEEFKTLKDARFREKII